MKICDASLLRRQQAEDEADTLEQVSAIIADVRARGDAALRDLTLRLDGVALDGFIVPDPHRALGLVSPDVLEALQLAAGRIDRFHRLQPAASWHTPLLGGSIGQRILPLERVGCYVPGGSAPLPSSVLHSVAIARVAGVREIVVVTPPSRMHAGSAYVHPAILAAAVIAGATRVLRIGGAQAIAALAYGTESVPPVDKIVGPGNRYVTLAKKLVFGAVGIDGLAGPTETLIIADDSANPAWLAADLLAQAEHDALASAILLTPSESLARAVQAEVAQQLESLPRAAIAAATFERGSGIVITRDLEEAAALADRFAPEHLCLAVRQPEKWADKVHHAGAIFLGEWSYEVLGDYIAGPSHVMPTAGTARFASPLTVLDFMRITSLVALDEATSAAIAPQAELIARAESLDGHARAASIRIGDR
jgi:histidinol dehydrogenase